MFCKSCGSKIEDKARFCPECGTKVEQLVTLQNDPEVKKYSVEMLLEKVSKRHLIFMGVCILVLLLGVVSVIGMKLAVVSSDKPGISLDEDMYAISHREDQGNAIYVPGVYSSALLLGNMNVELQITVDKDHINSIDLVNLDESVTTLYPLMTPTLQELSETILKEQSIEGVSYNGENRYTSMLLMQAITEALDKACVSENTDRSEAGIIY